MENAFEILKGRFRIFQRPLECACEDIWFAIVLISALYSFLIDVRDDSREWLDDDMVNESDGIDLDENIEQTQMEETTRRALIHHMRWKLNG